ISCRPRRLDLLAVPLSEVELPLGGPKAFVNDRDHFVDFFFADHERWAKLDRHKGAAQKPTLLHQLGDTATERMARRRRSPTERHRCPGTPSFALLGGLLVRLSAS